MVNTIARSACLVGVISIVLGACASTQTPIAGGSSSAADESSSAIVFKSLDYFENVGEDAKEYDARLILDPANRILIIADENHPEDRTFVTVPYDNIRSLTYERSAHPRIKAGLLIAWPMLFLKGKKHWLTVDFKDVPAYPAGYAYARMDKSNYRQIISALEGQTDLEVEMIEE